MKGFLKKHGKKVSVGLLATALMITPMLNVVNAASDDTCEIRYHYFFMEAENGWIDSTYEKAGTKITQRSYTSQYLSHYGLSLDDYNAFEGDDSSIGSYSSGVTAVANGKLYGDAYKDDGNGAKAFSANPNLTMTSEAIFYNLQLPEGYDTVVSREVKNSWTDEEYQIYFEMLVNSLNVSDGDELEAYISSEGEDDYYFIHTAWSNRGTEGEGDAQYLNQAMEDWRNSQESAALPNQLQLSELTDDEIQQEIEILKNASVEIENAEVLDIDHAGEGDNYGTVTATITRTYGDMSKPKAFATPVVTVDNDPSSGNELIADPGVTVTDTYHWYYMPAMLTVTYQAQGDYCGTDAPIEENTGNENPATGVASYAIIGTLLVGAGSAYIYARKNNKFNRL